MSKKTTPPVEYVQPYRYPSPNIPMSAICRFARQIAEKFQPDRIILFGSYAYGTPHNESDVDLLIVMPARDVVAMSVRISLAFELPFSLDLLVRTPKQLERGLKDNNWFLCEVLAKGKVLYSQGAKEPHTSRKGQGRLGETPVADTSGLWEALPGPRNRRETAKWVCMAEEALESARRLGCHSPPFREPTCWQCQQSAEKYLKGLLQHHGDAGTRTHDLASLLDLLLPYDATLEPLRKTLISLSRYADDDGYPKNGATTRAMLVALRQAERVRTVVRDRLGLGGSY